MSMSVTESISVALSAGWKLSGTKVTPDGSLKFGFYLETTGEQIWFDKPTLVATFSPK